MYYTTFSFVDKSLPNYLSRSYVRAFHREEVIRDRYGDILEFVDNKVFKSKGRWNHKDAFGRSRIMMAKIFVFKCIKKGSIC